MERCFLPSDACHEYRNPPGSHPGPSGKGWATDPVLAGSGADRRDPAFLVRGWRRISDEGPSQGGRALCFFLEIYLRRKYNVLSQSLLAQGRDTSEQEIAFRVMNETDPIGSGGCRNISEGRTPRAGARPWGGFPDKVTSKWKPEEHAVLVQTKRTRAMRGVRGRVTTHAGQACGKEPSAMVRCSSACPETGAVFGAPSACSPCVTSLSPVSQDGQQAATPNSHVWYVAPSSTSS